MKYSLQIQQDEVKEAVRARYSMIRPIIQGMLFRTQGGIIEALGGHSKITLEQLARVYKESDGDYGICFEYAVHDSIRRRDPRIYPIIGTVLEDFCSIVGDPESILFGAEKSGATHIIESAANVLTTESRVLVGKAGQPPKLKPRLDTIVKAVRSLKHRGKLPQSISGLWKADLFVGSPKPDQWVATTLKINKDDFEAAPGLRIGLYPERKPGSGPARGPDGRLILCPLPYRGDFMRLFLASFGIAKQLMAAEARMPKPVALYYEDDQTVAEWLSDRRTHPVVDILDALAPIAQPDLLVEKEEIAQPVTTANDGPPSVVAAPIPKVDD